MVKCIRELWVVPTFLVLLWLFYGCSPEMKTKPSINRLYVMANEASHGSSFNRARALRWLADNYVRPGLPASELMKILKYGERGSENSLWFSAGDGGRSGLMVFMDSDNFDTAKVVYVSSDGLVAAAFDSLPAE
jgi:hypothetical protein